MSFFSRTFVWIAFFAVSTLAPSFAQASDESWHVVLNSNNFGPMEFYLKIEEKNGKILGHSNSKSAKEIAAFPGAKNLELQNASGLFSFEGERQGATISGSMKSPWSEGQITITHNGQSITGEIKNNWLAGTFSGAAEKAQQALRDYPKLIAELQKVVAAKIFDPKQLETPGYKEFVDRMKTISASAVDDLDFILAFHFGWTNDPFSHFQIRRFDAPTEQIIASFDGMNVGFEAASVKFEGEIAILSVKTMMGNDTIEQIKAAYKAIAQKGSKALIIDLRGNGGGAFAVKPLVEHILEKPIYPGYFVSQKWNVAHENMPTQKQLEKIEPWQGWSIKAFWRSVQDDGVMRLQFHPAQPKFNGPVFVLIDHQSASATELAVDALRGLSNVTIVGEKTAGEMLSQSFFDVANGFVVSLPVADYYSIKHGRIEGQGIAPDVQVKSAAALDEALGMAMAKLEK